jgi:hypothetical protein
MHYWLLWRQPFFAFFFTRPAFNPGRGRRFFEVFLTHGDHVPTCQIAMHPSALAHRAYNWLHDFLFCGQVIFLPGFTLLLGTPPPLYRSFALRLPQVSQADGIAQPTRNPCIVVLQFYSRLFVSAGLKRSRSGQCGDPAAGSRRSPPPRSRDWLPFGPPYLGPKPAVILMSTV